MELYGDLAGEMLARQLGHAPCGVAAVAAAETARAITGGGAAGRRIQAAVEELDVAIHEIRAMVFGRRGARQGMS